MTLSEESSGNGDRAPVGVEIVDVRKSYDNVEVLHGVSLTVEPGEIFVIMGPSGSGKSVLLRQIVGLERPTSGEIRVNGLDPSETATRDRIALGLVFQAGALFNSMTVFDNLALYPHEHRLYDAKAIREKVEKTLEMLSLKDAGPRFPSELSGGMKKRVAIARALVMEPQLLLYDEPTSELDPIMAATISEIIATLKQQVSVTSVVVSHDRDLALTIADRIALIMKGKIVTIGTPDDFRRSTDPVVREFLSPAINPQDPRYRKKESES